ncbi:MAG: hypothetical protein ACLPV8_22795 [Steroidobacteraceae bacterium]
MKWLTTMMFGAAAGAAAFSLLGCHDPFSPTYSVGGTVTGLLGSDLVLEDNSGNALTVDSNGGFAFGAGLDNGAPTRSP